MELEDVGAASGPLPLFCARLKNLQEESGISQASLLRAVHLGKSQMSDILNGNIKRLPDWDVTIAVVRACLEYAKAEGRPVRADLRDERDWRRRHTDLERDLESLARSRPRREGPIVARPLAGRPLAGVTDPFALEVHQPFRPDDLRPGIPLLPTYVPREHDSQLAAVVEAAVDGRSGIAVLVGGSSTGKTRACWEALNLLRKRPEQWRLWHPIDPVRPEAALRELPSVGPRTVVWLNEAQSYLGVTASGLGERVAAGLREALRDPARAPILVLATLWPQHWDGLTTRPLPRQDDPHAQARELLAGREISVPAAFTADQLGQAAAAGDPRLESAAGAADGQVIQFLAGAPALLARYRNAPPAAAALINAAMDARRLGMGLALPLDFLEHAVPEYMSDLDWDALPEDWLEQALAYTAAPCNGVRGPLSRIRPRTTRGTDQDRGPTYRLADYLEQHGRRARRACLPPASFWDAALSFAAPANLPALARGAEALGLPRDAARFRKRAAACGDAYEAATLIRDLDSLHPNAPDPRPAQWAATHAALDDLDAVAGLLDTLRETGARQQVLVLADRAAANAPLHSPGAVATLLHAMRKANAQQQATTLLTRDPATQVALDDPDAVAMLLRAMRLAGAEQQATILLARDPAGHANPDALSSPCVAARLLDALRKANAQQQAAALAGRAAARAAIDDPGDVAMLLRAMRLAGAEQQAATLAGRAAARAAISNPGAVALLLHALREAGAERQAAVLLARDPAGHASLHHSSRAVAMLLRAMRLAGAEQQAAALADRAAVHPEHSRRLREMLRAGQESEAEKAWKQAGRPLYDFEEDLFDFDEGRIFAGEVSGSFDREPGGSPAPSWGWDDLD